MIEEETAIAAMFLIGFVILSQGNGEGFSFIIIGVMLCVMSVDRKRITELERKINKIS